MHSNEKSHGYNTMTASAQFCSTMSPQSLESVLLLLWQFSTNDRRNGDELEWKVKVVLILWGVLGGVVRGPSALVAAACWNLFPPTLPQISSYSQFSWFLSCIFLCSVRFTGLLLGSFCLLFWSWCGAGVNISSVWGFVYFTCLKNSGSVLWLFSTDMMLSCRGAGVAPFFARFEAWRRSLLLISLLMGLVCLCLSFVPLLWVSQVFSGLEGLPCGELCKVWWLGERADGGPDQWLLRLWSWGAAPGRRSCGASMLLFCVLSVGSRNWCFIGTQWK